MSEYRWIDLGDGRQVFRKVQEREPLRSHLPTPYAVTDCMAPVQSQLDGKMYDSKSALRATYRAAGMIEVGNDPARLRPRKPIGPDDKAITESIQKALAKASAS